MSAPTPVQDGDGFERGREALAMLIERIEANSEWDEGCFYFHGTAAHELIEPLRLAKQVLALDQNSSREWRRVKLEFIGAMRQALLNSGLSREQVIIADNAITEAFSALSKATGGARV